MSNSVESDGKHVPSTSPDRKGFGEVYDLDDAVLRAQGHVAELERSFSWVGAIGLAYSGWGPAPAWLMSIGVGQYCFAATSACTHIAEEMPDPGRKLPQVM
ncbi:hypothetical protein APSETT444_002441 [Aspergillus pseudonomiae]